MVSLDIKFKKRTNKTMLFKDAYNSSKTMKKIKEMRIRKVITVEKKGCYDEERAEERGFGWVMFCVSVLGDRGMGILFITTVL